MLNLKLHYILCLQSVLYVYYTTMIICMSEFSPDLHTKYYAILTHTILGKSTPKYCMYMCSCVAQWKSIASAAQKVVGSIPREHTY